LEPITQHWSALQFLHDNGARIHRENLEEKPEIHGTSRKIAIAPNLIPTIPMGMCGKL